MTNTLEANQRTPENPVCPVGLPKILFRETFVRDKKVYACQTLERGDFGYIPDLECPRCRYNPEHLEEQIATDNGNQ